MQIIFAICVFLFRAAVRTKHNEQYHLIYKVFQYIKMVYDQTP